MLIAKNTSSASASKLRRLFLANGVFSLQSSDSERISRFSDFLAHHRCSGGISPTGLLACIASEGRRTRPLLTRSRVSGGLVNLCFFCPASSPQRVTNPI